MTLEDSVRRHRLAILHRAGLLGSVTQACREAGISRTLFYRWRPRYLRYGAEELRPRPTLEEPQYLCLDKGYDFPEIETAARKRHYTTHIRHRGECVPRRRRHPARRWVVELTGSWHNRFRKLLIRFEKRMEIYRGLIHFACALIVYRLIVLQ